MATRGVSGDFAKLSELIRSLSGIATPQVKTDLGKLLGQAALTTLAHEFTGAHDPYGKPWPPLKTRKGEPLRDTGRLMNSFSRQGNPNGFSISTRVAYADVHQYGGTIKPHARKGGTMAFSTKGRIISKAAAGKRKSAVRIAITKDRIQQGFTIPRRQMIPENDTGGVGPIWGKKLNDEADVALRRYMKVSK